MTVPAGLEASTEIVKKLLNRNYPAGIALAGFYGIILTIAGDGECYEIAKNYV